ncbi:Tex family protein [Tetragenococcus solitarius]|uniref:Tex family protein n=1 Tax=Tetragenococcus solitarius TaxID=71453 RepID=A0ABN3Y9E0_9ENTE|nr:Tex family protein [Tetragenococcus solitarius]
MAQEINQELLTLLQQDLKQYRPKQIQSVLVLLKDGNTVPFIARYRKEATGELDEVQIREIEERYHYLENLENRKEEVLRLIDEQGKLSLELKNKILQADKMQQVEDLYRPYKQKRRTKATIAKENGLAPLSKWLLNFPQDDIYDKAQTFVNDKIPTAEEALLGAHEIMAEQISDTAKFRSWIRNETFQNGCFESHVKDADKDEKGVYEMYYDFSEPLKKMVSHRILACNRGEKEGILNVSLEIDETKIFHYLYRQLVKDESSPAVSLVVAAYEDAYKRFIGPGIERELRNELKEKADEQAITIFGENLHNLLLQPPLKGKTVLGFDPAYRTGCKLAVCDRTGKVLAIEVIYPHKPASAEKRKAADKQFCQLVENYQVDMIAIGNGTASRESEQFVAKNLQTIGREVFYVMVNEAGASVYSASSVARQEFPDLQVEERSAISIGRRLQDPLAELVKIDPKAVGVGQYQHDVSQKRLNEQLDFVVETAVNQVGVDVNTASPQLLQYVSGLNKTTAANVVNYREEKGAFTKRTQLKKVPRLGPKAYEQAIGFLRIPEAQNILDNTAIHPESYAVAKRLLEKAQLGLSEVGSIQAKQVLERFSLKDLSEELEVGRQTLKDIINALIQPGRDMRDSMPAPLLRKDVLSMDDLKVGMKLSGTVRNVIDFGAFVDIGVKQDGLVHISKLSSKFVKHPNDVVSVGDVVTVWVEQVDLNKGRISLTMVDPGEAK